MTERLTVVTVKTNSRDNLDSNDIKCICRNKSKCGKIDGLLVHM